MSAGRDGAEVGPLIERVHAPGDTRTGPEVGDETARQCIGHIEAAGRLAAAEVLLGVIHVALVIGAGAAVIGQVGRIDPAHDRLRYAADGAQLRQRPDGADLHRRVVEALRGAACS